MMIIGCLAIIIVRLFVMSAILLIDPLLAINSWGFTRIRPFFFKIRTDVCGICATSCVTSSNPCEFHAPVHINCFGHGSVTISHEMRMRLPVKKPIFIRSYIGLNSDDVDTDDALQRSARLFKGRLNLSLVYGIPIQVVENRFRPFSQQH